MRSIEQQIYASLALEGLKAGHHTHAATSGLEPAELEQYEELCNQWGQYESGTEFQRALLQIPLHIDAPEPSPPSHHIVALVTYQGRDAGGRPGAMLRHIVRIPADVYVALDFNPFHLMRTDQLLERWSPDTPFPVLDGLSAPGCAEDLKAIFPERYPLLRALLTRLLADGQLRLPSSSDSPAAEETLAHLFELIPLGQRPRLRMATFAYSASMPWDLCVVRQEGAGLRRSLQEVQTGPMPGLDARGEAYVAEVFAALEQRDFDRALARIRGDRLDAPPGDAPVASATPPPAMEEPPPAPEIPTPPPAAPTPPPPAAGGPPPPAPVYRRQAPKTGPPWGRIFAGVLVLAVIAVVGYFGLRGRGEPEDGRPPQQERVRTVEGATVAELVDRQADALAGMLAQGMRDFDLVEAGRAALETFDERLAETLRSEDAGLEQRLRAADDEVVAQADALAAEAERAAADAARLAGLHSLLSAGDAAPMRAAFDEETGALTLPEIEPTAPAVAAAGERAASLARGADALRAWGDAATGLDPAAWQGARQLLDAAVDGHPEGSTVPAIVSAAQQNAAAVQALLSAQAGLERWAARLPYPAARWTQGDLGATGARLVESAERVRRAGLSPPQTLASWSELHRIARDDLGGLFRSGGDPAALLASLAEICPGPQEGVCVSAAYAPHVARWKLRAFERMGSAAGVRAHEQLGAAALPVGDRAQLEGMLLLLSEMSAAPSPAPPELVERVRAGRARMGAGLYERICSEWIGAQTRASQSHQAGFSQAYADMRGALEELRSASGSAGAAAFARLRRSAQAMAALDLSQAGSQADQAAQVAAARRLMGALSEPHPIPVESVRVQLLTESDYSGAHQPVARLQVELRRGSEALFALEAPPLLSAPGVGFEAAELRPADPPRIAADDRLLVVGRDAGTGNLWFHDYVEAPAGGHVGSALAQPLEIHVPESVARASATLRSGLPALDGSGDPVARVQFRLAEDWWARLARQLPDLP